MASVLDYRYTGGAANANPNLSLGGVTSSVSVNSVALNNLFANVSPNEIVTGDDVKYRAFDIKNIGDVTAYNMEFFLTDTTNTESILAVWYDSSGSLSIVDEDTEPAGAAGNWTTPVIGSKLSLPDLAAGSYHRIWIRRTVDQGASPLNDDTGTLHCWYS